MEGLIDWVLRDVLTSVGGIDQCSTEFIRVTDRLLPEEIFLKFCPELKTGSRTRSGVPVLVQLLGGHPQPLAESAVRAAELGAFGVDFNFGCPAKTVNRHDGGASLLKSPERIFNILSEARKHVPVHIPVTAKIRLGFDRPEGCVEVAEAVEAAGIRTLTVHCRTKTDMYKPPAYWDWIVKIKEKTKLNIIANGEIWTSEDLQRCRQITGCEEFMIGRGAIANPFLFKEIKNQHARSIDNNMTLQKMIPAFYESCITFRNESYAVARTKQWLSQISKRDSQTLNIFNQIKTITQPEQFQSQLLGFYQI